MTFKTLLILFALTLLCSCGGLEKEKESLLAKPENKDLVNTFDINKEQAELYKESEAKDDKTKKIELKVKETKVSKKSSKVEVAKAALALSPAKTIAPLGFSYPADYTQDLKDYDNLSKSVLGKFKPIFYQGEQSIMDISYLGVTAGYLTILSKDVVKISDKEAYHYFARFKSKDAFRYLYWLNDTIDTFVEKSTFLPIKYSLIQREKIHDVDDLELFDFKKLKTYNWYKRVKDGKTTLDKIENYIPRFTQDNFSALQFIRGLPLKKGDFYEFPIVNRGKPFLLKVEVMGEEVTSVNGNDIKAYKLKAETHFPGGLKKSGEINLWYSADETRKLLKFQAKVKIGSIYGELVEYRPGILVK